MADYYQLKNQNIFNPPANTDMGNANSQFNTMYVQNALVLGNVSVTGTTIIAPRVTTITYPGDDTAADTAGGQTITLTGTGFVAGASVLINGSAVGVVSVVSSTVITFTSPANTTGSYVIYVINPDGSTAIAIPGIQYSGTPTWTTAAGTLGNVYETANFTQTVTATGDAPITYSVVSGSLPPGSTFNANGTITGTSQLSASPTTYSFTVRATDAEQQDTNRAFSIAVIPDVVTWSTPTDNATYTPAANIAIANITLSATSAVGSGITYSANTLPTGLSLTGANISGTPTVVANTSSLLTATANTTTESSSITINWSVSVASDPYFMYNSLLLPGTGTNGAQNNTFLDGSTNNFTITRNGNTTQGTFSPYGPNWSNYFDGDDDYLSVANNAALNLGSSNYTIECWFFCSSAPTANDGLISKGNTSSTGAETWSLEFVNSSGNVGYSVGAFNGMSAYVLSSSSAATINAWNHVAVVRNGTSHTMYLNGASVATATASYTVTSAGSLYVGTGWYAPTVRDYIGYISNARLVVGTAVYTSNFTPSSTPLTAIANTSLLTCQSNRFIDNSSNAFALTVSGTPTIQRFSPFSPTATYSTSTIGGSGYFDGTGDYLSIPSSASLAIGTLSATVEFWIYPTDITGYQRIIAATLGDFGAGIFFIRFNGGTFLAGDSGNTAVISSTLPVLNAWNHVAWVGVGGASQTLYINGINVGTATTYNLTTPIQFIGGLAHSFINGYISNLRIVKGTAVYTANFVPSSAPLTAITNTQLLTDFTNAGIIDNTMINNLETVGNAQISTAQTKFGSGSMYFDGTGDYLNLRNNPVFAFNTGDFTIEAWVYPTATHTGDGMVIFDQRTTYATSAGINMWLRGSTNVLAFSTNGNQEYAGSLIAPVNTWTHVAVVKSSGVIKSYVNGVLSTTFTYATSLSDTSACIGRSTDTNPYYYFEGYIDDLRITKGYARYTSNFTPATSAFPTY